MNGDQNPPVFVFGGRGWRRRQVAARTFSFFSRSHTYYSTNYGQTKIVRPHADRYIAKIFFSETTDRHKTDRRSKNFTTTLFDHTRTDTSLRFFSARLQTDTRRTDEVRISPPHEIIMGYRTMYADGTTIYLRTPLFYHDVLPPAAAAAAPHNTRDRSRS
jgi:hypothetical protein